jgi:hypothetical protein
MWRAVLLLWLACNDPYADSAKGGPNAASPGAPGTKKPKQSEVVDLSGFSRACQRDTDCTLVERGRCNPCRCATTALAVTERGRYMEALAGIHCEGATITPCVHCDELVPVCKNGKCAAKSTEVQPANGECHSDEDCVVSCANTDDCCEQSPCETVISKTALADVLSRQPAGCKAAKCRAPDHASYVTPRCKAGKCFAAFD